MNAYFSSYTKSDWLLVVIRVILGLLFIFSGVVKINPIEPFELKFVELGVANWALAPYFARIIVGIEFFLGAMLILNIKPKFTLYATLSLLIFFTAYLTYDLIVN